MGCLNSSVNLIHMHLVNQGRGTYLYTMQVTFLSQQATTQHMDNNAMSEKKACLVHPSRSQNMSSTLESPWAGLCLSAHSRIQIRKSGYQIHMQLGHSGQEYMPIYQAGSIAVPVFSIYVIFSELTAHIYLMHHTVCVNAEY